MESHQLLINIPPYTCCRIVLSSQQCPSFRKLFQVIRFLCQWIRHSFDKSTYRKICILRTQQIVHLRESRPPKFCPSFHTIRKDCKPLLCTDLCTLHLRIGIPFNRSSSHSRRAVIISRSNRLYRRIQIRLYVVHIIYPPLLHTQLSTFFI